MHDHISGLSIYHPPGQLVRPPNPFGKDIANAALFRGLAAHGGFTELAVLNQYGHDVDKALWPPDLLESVSLNSAPLTDTVWPSRHGTLLRGQPYLSELSWLRRNFLLDCTYSLVGLIHTTAPPVVRQLISSSAIAPVHSWDALVCTSPSVQQGMHHMFDAQAEHMALRLGCRLSPRPQLPLIPLGVDTDKLALEGCDQDARAQLRFRLGIPDDEILVLWVGRLSYYEKAFPQSMFQAVSLAASDVDVPMHFLLVGWFPGGDAEMQLYKQAAEILSPDLNVIVMDGNDSIAVAQSWAAADIFLSLVDNIQETFGLTPIEAMSAGLPVVVSDWDGYSYTVRDGEDGFLIPTLGSPGGQVGELLASLHSLESESYQTYVGATAQHTAVNVPRAAAALSKLARSADLRRSMGLSGQSRAHSMFSWSRIASQYRDLFDSLASIRATADPELAALGSRVNPSRGEPFADFQHFSSSSLEPSLLLRLADGVRPVDLHQRLAVDLNRLFPGLRATTSEALSLLESLEIAGDSGLTASKLLDLFPSARRPYLETTLVWLAKMNLIDWLPSEGG